MADSKVYFVYERGEYAGFYIIATTRARAKYLYQMEVDAEWVDIRCHQMKNYDVVGYEEQVLDVGNPILEDIGLHYCDEDGNEI